MIGSGSAPFEVICALVERVGDVVEYLVETAKLPATGTLTFEIAGADVTSSSLARAR